MGPKAPPPSPRVVLIGPPGVGKSTIGQAVASRLGWSFLDTDEAIESVEGRTISDIFVDDGEEHFRSLERAAVARALAESDGVVALGGGAPVADETQKLLAGHHVVFLDVGIADAARRIGFDGNRPMLAMSPRATWVALMEARRPIYERLATHRVDTAGRTPEVIVDEIVRVLEDS